MGKTIKFTISMSAAEFKNIESRRRKTGRTRSQFIRDALVTWSYGPVPPPSIKEDRSEYRAKPSEELPKITNLAERRRRAVAAAGQFRSGAADLSSDHDRYLEEALAEDSPGKDKD